MPSPSSASSLSLRVWGALPDHFRWLCKGNSICGSLHLRLPVPLGPRSFPAHTSVRCSQGKRMETVQHTVCLHRASAAGTQQSTHPSTGLSPWVLASHRVRPKPRVAWHLLAPQALPNWGHKARKRERLLRVFCFKVPSPNPKYCGSVQLFNQCGSMSATFVSCL